MITDRDIIDVCGRVSELLAAKEEPCQSWTVFIRWIDKENQRWTLDYEAHDCETYEQAVHQVMGYITSMPDDWRIDSAWAARATDIYKMDGYRFNRTPQFQVR